MKRAKRGFETLKNCRKSELRMDFFFFFAEMRTKLSIYICSVE